jgi:hypothetical protein
MKENQALIQIGFEYREGDDTHSCRFSDKFHLEVDKGKLYIVCDGEKSVTDITSAELTPEMIARINATVKVLISE